MTFSPTITVMSTPAVTLTSTNITYNQIKNSLGNYVFLVDKLYILATDFKQINAVMRFKRYDANGNSYIDNLVPAADLYQKEASIEYNTEDSNVIIDGKSNLFFNLLPNVNMQLKLYCKKISMSDKLQGKSNFDKVETATGDYTFFEDFNDKIIRDKIITS